MVTLCECGCGEATPIADRNERRWGWVKGQPKRFVLGHNTGAHNHGYRAMKLPNGDLVHLHRLRAEAALGKPLPKGADVHHVDENKNNNVSRNLVICQDRAYHSLLHFRLRVLRAGGDPNTQKVCSRCKQPKDFDQFYKVSSTRVHRHRHNYCRECVRERNRLRYRKAA